MSPDELRERVASLVAEVGTLSGATVLLRPQVHEKRRLRQSIADRDLLKVSEGLFEHGHHARAVEEAFKYLNNLVKDRSGRFDLDGAALMRTALSAKSPLLRLNAGVTQSEGDEQLGYMEMCAGSMTGIRNPRAHEHDWEDSEGHALQMLVLADHLVGRIKTASKVQPTS